MDFDEDTGYFLLESRVIESLRRKVRDKPVSGLEQDAFRTFSASKGRGRRKGSRKQAVSANDQGNAAHGDSGLSAAPAKRRK